MRKYVQSSLCVFLLISSVIAEAQQGKFKINGFEQDKACPIFRSVDKKTGDSYYDSRVIGYPRFFPGYIVTLDGERLNGNIAVFNNQTADWSFVKKCLLIIPEGEEEAQFIGGGILSLISQQQKKEEVIFDLYEGAYLERLVSGKLRLSFNPNANTTRKVTGFISKEFIDSLRVNTARNSIKESLNAGKNLDESLAIASAKDQLITIGSAVEIIEKEYLIYNEQTGETQLITKANYEQVIQQTFAGCSAMDAKTISKYANKYTDIKEAVEAYNAECK